MKYVRVALLAMLLFVVFCPVAAAQAAVEYGLGAATAATAAAPARNAAQGIAGALDSLKKAVEGGLTTSPAASVLQPLLQPAAPKSVSIQPASAADTHPATAAVPVFEDPSHIQAGLEYDELLRRFGPPAISTTSESGKTTLWYSKSARSYPIELKGRKVVLATP
jgi:hypothetical protein